MPEDIRVAYHNYIEHEDISDGYRESKKSHKLNIVLFACFGCCTSWALVDSFYCDLAWFETSQPEGVDLASWFALSQAMGALIVLGVLYLDTYQIYSKHTLVYISCGVSVAVTVMVSICWKYTVNGASVFLYIGVMFAVVMAWIQYVMIIPWLVRNFNPRMLSPFFGGGGMFTMFLVLLEIIQQPGGARTFSPSVYFLIAAIVNAGSMGAAIYILQNNIERIEADSVNTTEPWQTSMKLKFFPPKWREAKKYVMIYMWIVFWTFQVIPVALPFASENTTNSSSNDGENYLQWVLAMGYIAVVLGYMGSYFVKEKFYIVESVVVFSLVTPIILLAAANVGSWYSWTMRVVLMLAVVIERFLFGWIISLIYREITLKFPDVGEAISTYASLWTMVASVVIMTLEWFLIYSGIV